MNDKNLIAHLLHLYYNGETTLEQEHTLREYFSGNAVDPEFVADKAIFDTLNVTAEAPDRLKCDVVSEIQRRYKQENLLSWRRYIWRAVSSVAAVALVALASIHFLTRQPAQPELTPEEIHQHALTALSLLTTTVGQGYSSMQTGLETTAETFGTANNALEKL